MFACTHRFKYTYLPKCLRVLTRDHCIIRHSLRYYRHSGPVIYKSKLPAPSVSMPCDYRILQSPPKGQVLLVLLETVGRSHLETLKEIDNCFASRASASKFRCIMSAVGTILLHSPGWNEGKARYETLGIHEPKVISSSVGAAL